MEAEEIMSILLTRFAGTVAIDAWGETSLFYNPDLLLPRGIYFATIKKKNGENDRASALDREGVFRFNLGLPKTVFLETFGQPPKRPGKGQVIEGPWDFTALDILTPHPVYGWMSWVAVVNPTDRIFNNMHGMITASFDKARKAFQKKVEKQSR